MICAKSAWSLVAFLCSIPFTRKHMALGYIRIVIYVRFTRQKHIMVQLITTKEQSL